MVRPNEYPEMFWLDLRNQIENSTHKGSLNYPLFCQSPSSRRRAMKRDEKAESPQSHSLTLTKEARIAEP